MSEKDIFVAALQKAGGAERAAYLDSACGDDSQLRTGVETLLREHERLGSFLESPALAVVAKPDRTVARSGAPLAMDRLEPRVLGDYRIVREIGRGGMGVVYEAEQISLGRSVALKVLPFTAMLDKTQLARFKNEARAAASLDHPNVVQVHAVGTERSVHYYAMQLINGRTVRDLIDGERHRRGVADATVADAQRRPADNDNTAPFPSSQSAPRTPPPNVNSDTNKSARNAGTVGDLPTEKRRIGDMVKLAIQAAQGLEHAHRMGIVHRDIKPSNLLVDAEHHLWVADFGLALVEAENNLSTSGSMLGTLRYMSPEQMRGDRHVLDHHTDIYSLGVTLYEILTLQPAFPDSDVTRLMQRIPHEEPIAPCKLNSAIPRDLETIVLTAMAKDHEDRYATAAEMAADLGRFLDDEPIVAKPPGTLERTRKWVRRHRAVVTTAGVTLLIAIAVAGSLLWRERNQTLAALDRETTERELAEKQKRFAQRQERLAKKQKRLADEQRAEAFQNHYYADMAIVQRDWEHGQTRRMQQVLDKYIRQPGKADVRGWEWYYLRSLPHRDCTTIGKHSAPVAAVSWSPDGTRLAAAFYDGITKIWDVRTKELVLALPGSRPVRHALPEWSSDGAQLAIAGKQEVKIWDVASSRERARLNTKVDVFSIAWSPDDKRIAVACKDKVLRIWDAPFARQPKSIHGHKYGPIYAVDWSPDGSRLASGGNDRKLRIWDPNTGQEVQTLPGHKPDLYVLEWSPDGRRIASGGWDAMTRVWDVNNGKEVASLASGIVAAVSWSADGEYLASSGSEQIRIFETETFQIVRHLKGHLGDVSGLQWSPTGNVLASGSGDVRLWDLGGLGDASESGVDTEDLSQMAWSSDDRFIAYVSAEKQFTVAEASTGRPVFSRPCGARNGRIAWSPDSEGIVIFSEHDPVQVWNLQNRQKLWSAGPRWDHTTSASWSPDGRRIALARSWPAAVAIYDARTGERTHAFQPDDGNMQRVCWSPNGKRLATASRTGIVRIWDARDWQQLHVMKGHRSWIASLCWSRDGKWLASAGSDRIIRIWDTDRGEEHLQLRGHTGPVINVAWSPKGDRLISASRDGTMRVWDTTTGREALVHYSPNHSQTDVAWSHDGTRILFAASSSLEILDASWAYAFGDDSTDGSTVDFFGNTARREDAIASYEDIIATWKRFLHDNPRVPEYRENLAKVVMKRGEFQSMYGMTDEAIASFREAIGILEKLAARDPDRRAALAECWVRLAALHAHLGSKTQRLDALRRAVEIRPDDPLGNNQLAWVLTTSPDQNVRDPAAP